MDTTKYEMKSLELLYTAKRDLHSDDTWWPVAVPLAEALVYALNNVALAIREIHETLLARKYENEPKKYEL